MVPGLNITAVGRIARQLGITAQLVEQVAAELHIQPAITIDNVAYFEKSAVTAMRNKMAGDTPDELDSPSP